MLHSKVGDYGYPGKSCLDILSQRTEATSLSNGEYWIVLGSTALKVYCDMKADGGILILSIFMFHNYIIIQYLRSTFLTFGNRLSSKISFGHLNIII
jgi:hypothetical protein